MTLLDNALRYLAGGISLVPCSHLDKRPEARLLPGGRWKPYQTSPADETTVRSWFATGCQSVAGIGGAVSGGLLVIDFDEARFYDSWKSYAGSVADELPTQRTGREGGGYQVWLRCERPGGSEKLAWVKDDTEETGRRCAIETKGEGGYAIMPGSLHPSGRHYERVAGDFGAIPVLPQPLVDSLLQAARTLDEAPQTRQQTEKAANERIHVGESVIDQYNHQTTIESVLASHGYQRADEKRWKRPNGKTPSVFVEGGRSFHHSANDPLNDGYWHSAFDAFCQLEHGGDCTAAVRSLADSFEAAQEPVDLRYLLNAALDEPREPEKNEPIELPDWVFENMPRLMRTAFDWCMATATKPQPQITLAALIPMFGAVFGRRVRDDYDTRSNVLSLCLAPSGSGKEHPRQCVKKILFHSGLDHLNGPERIGSSAGLVSAIAQHPSKLFQLDEIGRMFATMRGEAAPAHLVNIGTVLMQLYSSANSIWIGDAYADINKVKRINQPCACVFGTSVPENFYSGLTISNLSDGLLSRMLVFEARGYANRRKPLISEPPFDLIEELREWAAAGPSGNMATENPTPVLVEKSAHANAEHEKYCDLVNAKHPDEDSAAASVWSRAPEKEAKLALIHALCTDWRKPEITLVGVLWGKRIVNYCTRLLLMEASANISQSRYQTEKLRVWKVLRSGMSMSDVTRKTQWLKSRERSEIIADLVAVGAIELVEAETSGRTRTTIKRISSCDIKS